MTTLVVPTRHLPIPEIPNLIVGAESRPELMKSSPYDTESSIEISMVSEVMHERFHTDSRSNGEEFFICIVRDSFRSLAIKAICLFDGKQKRFGALQYKGSVGAGKSYNLAALVSYFRIRRAKGFDFALSVVYVASCEKLFQDPVRNLQTVLREAFPTEKDEIKACSKWDELVSYVKGKPKRSIIFVLDDWNYVIPEEKHLAVEQKRLLEYRDKLLCLTGGQYRIEAITSGSESATSVRKAPANTDSLNLFGGLTASEWLAWKRSSTFFTYLDNDDEAMVVDFTGLVPLYLRMLEDLTGDLRERIEKFEKGVGDQIRSSLSASSESFCSTNARSKAFIAQMTAAIGETDPGHIDDRLYDHRFFYKTETHVIKPVSGLVRRCMRDYLDGWRPMEFRNRINLDWINCAFKCGNPSVCGFAFEEYALLQILLFPSLYIADLPTGISCSLLRLDGHYPTEGELNTEGLTMFWPTKFNLPHEVNAVLRYVLATAPPAAGPGEESMSESESQSSSEGVVKLYALRVTSHSPPAPAPAPQAHNGPHKKSQNFYLCGVGDSEKYIKRREMASSERYLVWVTATATTTGTGTGASTTNLPVDDNPSSRSSSSSSRSSSSSSRSSSSASTSTSTLSSCNYFPFHEFQVNLSLTI